MKFLIDAQLPETLADFFKGHDVVHTIHLTNSNRTTDNEINVLSVQEKMIVITKDTDFYYSYITNKVPYKLILVKLGNTRIKDLIKYFSENASKIITLITVNSFIVLEKDKISILD